MPKAIGGIYARLSFNPMELKMRSFLSAVALSALCLAAASAQAAFTTTADLVTVVADGPGTWTYSVGGWDGGGVVTGSFAGADADLNGQLSSFNGEVTNFTMSYSGGTSVSPLAFVFADLFGLVYDLSGGPLGDGLLFDIEGIGAGAGGNSFNIGPGPVDLCGAGVTCGIVEGSAAGVPEPGTLALLGLALAGMAASRCRKQ